MSGTTKRPNIILIMTDQQRYDQIGFASGGHFQTPNLDRLAQKGVVFQNAYSSSTVCVPARTSLLTGLQHHRVPKQPHHHLSMREGYWTIARALRVAGYRTGLVGKMHFSPIHSQHGFDVTRMCEHLAVSAGYGPQDIDDFYKWLLWNGRADWKATHIYGPGRETEVKEYNEKHSAVPFGYDKYFHPTEWIKRGSLEFLAKQSEQDPFLLIISFPHPHAPYDPPEPYASMFDPADAILPEETLAVNERLPPAFRNAIMKHRVNFRQPIGNVSDDVTRRILTYVRALIRHIDDAVGEVLEQVDLTKTTVFFTSDHGDFSGHRGMLAKSPWITFDDLARVPFFAAGFGVSPGQQVTQLVQSCDFALTALELAGVTAPPAIDDTRSLVPYFEGRSVGADRAVFCCTSLSWPMIREADLKYFLHQESGDEMLFDLAKDPGETVNLIGDPLYGARESHLRNLLKEELGKGIPDLPTL